MTTAVAPATHPRKCLLRPILARNPVGRSPMRRAWCALPENCYPCTLLNLSRIWAFRWLSR